MDATPDEPTRADREGRRLARLAGEDAARDRDRATAARYRDRLREGRYHERMREARAQERASGPSGA